MIHDDFTNGVTSDAARDGENGQICNAFRFSARVRITREDDDDETRDDASDTRPKFLTA